MKKIILFLFLFSCGGQIYIEEHPGSEETYFDEENNQEQNEINIFYFLEAKKDLEKNKLVDSNSIICESNSSDCVVICHTVPDDMNESGHAGIEVCVPNCEVREYIRQGDYFGECYRG